MTTSALAPGYNNKQQRRPQCRQVRQFLTRISKTNLTQEYVDRDDRSWDHVMLFHLCYAKPRVSAEW